MIVIYVIFWATVLLNNFNNAQNTCRTPDNKSGICIVWRDCAPLAKIANNYRSESEENRTFFRRSRCGGTIRNPSVCCESQPVATRFSAQNFPPPGSCGSNIADRIVGGKEAELTDFRWLALIQYSKDGHDPEFLCGGSLIHNSYVLTAAHCVKGRRLISRGWIPTSVRLGEHDLEKTRDCIMEGDAEYGEETEEFCADDVINVPIYNFKAHEDYVPESSSQANDIALVRLARPVKFTNWVKPVCLPFADNLKNLNYDHYPLEASGFGLTENVTTSTIKRKVGINGTDWESCANKYATVFSITLTRSQLCAGGTERKDTCAGDSGGPLMGTDHSNRNNPYIFLAGIISRGPRNCGTPGFPSIYTRTDQFLDWIVANMQLT